MWESWGAVMRINTRCQHCALAVPPQDCETHYYFNEHIPPAAKLELRCCIADHRLHPPDLRKKERLRPWAWVKDPDLKKAPRAFPPCLFQTCAVSDVTSLLLAGHPPPSSLRAPAVPNLRCRSCDCAAAHVTTECGHLTSRAASSLPTLPVMATRIQPPKLMKPAQMHPSQTVPNLRWEWPALRHFRRSR